MVHLLCSVNYVFGTSWKAFFLLPFSLPSSPLFPLSPFLLWDLWSGSPAFSSSASERKSTCGRPSALSFVSLGETGDSRAENTLFYPASRQKYRAPNDVNSKATAFGSELGASAKVNLRLSCPWGISLGPSCHKERGLLAFYFIFFLREIVCIIYIK